MENNEANIESKSVDDWGQHEETDIATPGVAAGENSYSSQELRQMANAYFAQRDYDSALPLYSMALESLLHEQEQEGKGGAGEGRDQEHEGKAGDKDYEDLTVTFLCNRAACLFKMELYGDAKADALQAVEISEGKNAKASFRLAKTQIAMGEYKSAIETLEKSIALLRSSESSTHTQHDESTSTTNSTELTGKEQINQQQQIQRQELEKLLISARTGHLKKKHNFTNAADLAKVKSIKLEPRKPSIREFKIDSELGVGNFSRVVTCHHTVTKESFALKIIEKKKAEQLAKQQHPNVYNEIEMERRILNERVKEDDGTESVCSRIVTMYHCFQDYNSLYFLMDVYSGDMWSALRYKNQMIGVYPSLAKIYLFELLEALEFLHARGIVHRDLKAENMLLSSNGHMVLIDFGTAKDLIKADLNGPEFVGTPDFMAPEAVKGTSAPDDVKKEQEMGKGSDHSLDLWEYGAVIYQLLTGLTPFHSPSPYLSFLKIQRGNLYRPISLADDDAWDLMVQLMQVNPKERLGADCFEYVREEEKGQGHKMIKKCNGYDVIRNHPYFASLNVMERNDDLRPIPSLKDLCLRACAELVKNDSLDLDIDKKHPPGDGSAHDMLRLKQADRNYLMGLLEKLRLLSQPRVYRRFFKTKQEARLTKVRQDSRDFVGLTQMIDKQNQFPTTDSEGTNNDMSDVLVAATSIKYMHISNPLFVKETNISCADEDQRKQWIVQLKENLKIVNKTRPTVAVATGYLDDACRKLLGKINETIPVILNNGSSFFSFWACGGQGLVLRSRDFIQTSEKVARNQQMTWLKQELEQSRTAQHHAFAFVDCDINLLPNYLIEALAKGKVLCLFGISSGSRMEKEFKCQATTKEDKMTDSHDECSIDSDDDSESDSEDQRTYTMKIKQGGDTTLSCITLEEYGVWKSEEVS